MKKGSLFILFALCVCSAFSIDKEKLDENINTGRHLTELMVDEEYAKRQKALAEERRRKREAETELYDGILDVKYHLEKYYVLRGKFIRVELFGKTGTFNIYCMPEGEKSVPLFSEADLFTSTGFFLKCDDEIFQLNKANRVKRELRRLENGAQLVYTIDDSVRFVADFSLLASKKDAAEDIVKVRLYAINVRGQERRIDIRGIFDTVCGEVSSVHFTTERGSKIRYETQFSGDEMKKERTVISSNGPTSFQFVLDGIGISPVEAVSFGNVDELYKMNWESRLRKGRGFTNIRGYDDSALMIDWPEFFLPQDGLSEYDFYIAAASQDESPRGLYYIDYVALSSPEAGDSENPEAEKQDDSPGIGTVPPAENAEKRTDVDFIVPTIKDYQLDPEYIQNLIDRIDALQSSNSVDKKELRKLNAELDAILDKLRRQ